MLCWQFGAAEQVRGVSNCGSASVGINPPVSSSRGNCSNSSRISDSGPLALEHRGFVRSVVDLADVP
ncbi:hypothetical protein B1756_04055 [Natrarchaeobaculum aegyptiacum]|uniref:Uncharacterized protein n=1 Tax=Natrarchaeobaculum aegyptiacum TaxID=745377 RepID=A0A2Z2HU57_9EURY|nr:hypothetical protein B1756_04055 [Natrarchaeobaculum aegyptiacum]